MKQRVLVVDDDQMVANTLQLIFEVNGFDSQAVYSAAAGLERARTFAPSLLLCDVTMPQETGLQLAEKLYRELPDCKVLMFSAYSTNAAKVEEHASKTQRPVRFLSKPCRPEDLLREANLLLKTA